MTLCINGAESDERTPGENGAYEPPVVVLLGNARDLLAGNEGSFPDAFNDCAANQAPDGAGCP